MDLIDRIVALSIARDPASVEDLLTAEPGLVSVEAIEAATEYVAVLGRRGEIESARAMATCRDLIRRAGEVGVGTATDEYVVACLNLPISSSRAVAAALAQSRRSASGNDAETIQTAVGLWWQVVTDPQIGSWPVTTRCFAYQRFAAALSARAVMFSHAPDAHQACAALAEVVRLQQRESDEAFARIQFASGLDLYGRLSGDAEQTQDAATMVDISLPNIAKNDYRRVEALRLAALVWGSRYAISGQLDDLDNELSALREATAIVDEVPSARVAIALALGNALGVRHERTKDERDINESINLLESALEVPPSPADRHLVMAALASSLRRRLSHGGLVADLERAAALLMEATASIPDGSTHYAGYVNNYGNVLVDLFTLSKRPEVLLEAVRAFEAAVESAGRVPDLPGYIGNLAHARRLLDEDVESSVASRHAVTSTFRKAISEGLGTSEELALDAALEWGHWAARRADWAEANEAWGNARRCVQTLLQRQHSRVHKETWLVGAQGLAAESAYALARLGDPVGAVVALEQGQGVLLSEALRLSEPHIEGNGATLKSIRAAAADQTLLYLAAATHGGVAVIADAAGIRSVLLPDISRSRLEEKAVPFLDSQQTMNGDFTSHLMQLTEFLSATVVDLVEGELDGRPIALVPVGPLASLPVWLAGSKRSLLDCTATVVPNVAALGAAPTLMVDRPSILTIADPQPTSQSPLAGARAEVSEIVRMLGAPPALTGTRAQRKIVLEALPGADLVHFACHAWARTDRPLESSMLLAYDETITLADLLEARLGARLVVLSACQSGVPGIVLPDEVVSLQTGLIQAGAAGVVASLWPVGDDATALLMSEFWRRQHRGSHPAEALRGAQQWLRSATVTALLEWCDEYAVAPELWTLVRRVLTGRDGAEIPYVDMQHWGAFSYSGS